MGSLSAPIELLEDRLIGQAATGKVLAGWNVMVSPKKHVKGKRDLPAVIMVSPDMSESYRPSGRHQGAEPSLSIRFTVSGDSKDPISDTVKLLETFLDAVENNHSTNQVDTTLGGTILRPFDVQVSDWQDGEVSRTADVVLQMKPRLAVRGQRSS